MERTDPISTPVQMQMQYCLLRGDWRDARIMPVVNILVAMGLSAWGRRIGLVPREAHYS
jgi:hypothetical protein